MPRLTHRQDLLDKEDPHNAEPFLNSLNVYELENLHAYRENFPGEAFQLNQNARAGRGMKSSGGALQTLIRNLGLLLLCTWHVALLGLAASALNCLKASPAFPPGSCCSCRLAERLWLDDVPKHSGNSSGANPQYFCGMDFAEDRCCKRWMFPTEALVAQAFPVHPHQLKAFKNGDVKLCSFHLDRTKTETCLHNRLTLQMRLQLQHKLVARMARESLS